MIFREKLGLLAVIMSVSNFSVIDNLPYYMKLLITALFFLGIGMFLTPTEEGNK